MEMSGSLWNQSEAVLKKSAANRRERREGSNAEVSGSCCSQSEGSLKRTQPIGSSWRWDKTAEPIAKQKPPQK